MPPPKNNSSWQDRRQHLSLTLRELAVSLGHSAPAIAIEKITLDSRRVSPGSLFIAVKGHHIDGRQFIDSALQQGAAAVIHQVDSAEQAGLNPQDHRLLGVHRLPEQLSRLAGAFTASLHSNCNWSGSPAPMARAPSPS
ncbi:Mur ligase domain-containing protein [Oceanimonas sp. NS1]|nr:Mur ligase domain-containing protein [Oceanimonas sp. NS1]